MEKYCNNCGNKGHLYRNCRHPILSYGIFIYTKDKNGEYETILVERKDSLASFQEFSRLYPALSSICIDNKAIVIDINILNCLDIKNRSIGSSI